MNREIDIIFCADGNRRFAEIAVSCGWLYGSQAMKSHYLAPYFVDVDPNKFTPLSDYARRVHEIAPHMATVMDWESREQLPHVLAWAEAIAPYVEVIVIIPKVVNGVKDLPKYIGNKPVRLGFSYPTRHGRASWDVLYEMAGWSHGIHVLGGSPDEQMALAQGRFKRKRRVSRPHLFTSALDIRSVDCNYHLLKATKWCQHWTTTGWISDNRGTPTDAPYNSFRMSCMNIMAQWRRLSQ